MNPTTAQNPECRDVQRGSEAAGPVHQRQRDGQFSDSCAAGCAYNNSWAKTDGLLPALNGTEPARSPTTARTAKFPNWSLSGNVDWVASPKLFFGVRGGYYMSDVHDSNVLTAEHILFSTGNNAERRPAATCRFPSGEPAAVAAFLSPPDIVATHHGPADPRLLPGGRNGVCAALAASISSSSACRPIASATTCSPAKPANRVRLRWNTSRSAAERGTYGYYSVRSNGVDPKRGFITDGNDQHDQRRPVHPGRVDDQQPADDQRRPADRT